MKKISLLSTLAIFVFMAMAFMPTEYSSNDNWREKVSPLLLSKADADEALNFLVILKEQKDVSAARRLKTKIARSQYVFEKLQQDISKSQKNIIQLLKNKRAKHSAFYIINAIQVKGDAQLLQTIAKFPEVKQINDNAPIKMQEPVEENYTNERGPNAIEWGIEMINADDVWAMGYNGQGVVVGGQDTGYEWEHPALIEKYRGNGTTVDHNYNWHDAIHEINPLHNDSTLAATNNPCGLDVAFPCDDNNHGTHTMGTMVGEDGDNQIGVAPGSSWVACRNMERGWGQPSTYIECFEWFMAPTDLNNENPDPSKAPHVIANSWSCPEVEGCDSTNWEVMEMVVNNLKASGVVVVVSAGNSGGQGCGSVSTPAAFYEGSFSIGATASNDTIAGFSSRGPVTANGSGILKPNVSAPGVSVRSSIRNGAYASFSGTSMAGPHAAGMVALVISANPSLAGQVELIEDIIESTAVPKTTDQECGGIPGSEIPNNTYGYGRIDALAAVTAALAVVDTEDNNLAEASAKIFPNPTQEWISIELNNLGGDTQFELFNTAGQLVRQLDWKLMNNEIKNISLKELSTGIYFYKIKNEEKELSGRVIKK